PAVLVGITAKATATKPSAAVLVRAAEASTPRKTAPAAVAGRLRVIHGGEKEPGEQADQDGTGGTHGKRSPLVQPRRPTPIYNPRTSGKSCLFHKFKEVQRPGGGSEVWPGRNKP